LSFTSAASPSDIRWFVPPPHRTDKVFVDVSGDVTIADLGLALREGFDSIELVKRYTTAGMGIDQGKTGNLNVVGAVAAAQGLRMEDVGQTTMRSPWTPVEFGALVGARGGPVFLPYRHTPLTSWHIAHGAFMFEAGARWRRPLYYPRAGETMNEAVQREARAVREAVAKQESIGLESITDGEFRRDWWHLDFMGQLDGVTMTANPGPKFGGTEEQPPIPSVTGKVKCLRPIMADHFAFLKSVTTRTPKMTIPSPSMLHLRGGRAAVSREAYPDLDTFWADVAAAYRKAIAHLYAAGCRYLQLDDITFAYLCDPKIQANCRANGDDPEALPRTYAETINAALADKPADLRVTIHTCRGNFKSAWVAEGGYDPVVEAMFSTEVDGWFMEFDSARAGGFEPLRSVPKGKTVVLGLVTTKVGELESKDALKRRIDEAAKVVPLEQLALSPQCGFSSTHHGNALSVDDQWRKLERVVEVAGEVWGH